VYIFRDDTERKRHEADLADARERAEAANRAKSLFLANMSHEIRTPLNGVIGAISLLERTPLDEKQQRHVHRLRLSSQLLLGLINDILDYSKMESKELAIEKTGFDLHQLMEDVGQMLEPLAQEKQLRFSIEIAPNIPKEVLGDPTRLRQILMNLIGNAIKFTERGSVHVTMHPQAQNIRFEIRDTGIGIPQEKQSQLFQKFFQGNNSTTRRYGGTGLGLAICKQLVELMQGTIGVDSTEGEGSTFWFTLPLSPILATAKGEIL
jgi:signal transduction histidine kinase